MAYTAKDAAGNTIYLDGAGTGADSGNAITPNSTIIGAINETAPGTDTASSGLNGRLQRIAVRLTSLIALLPSSIGQKAKTGSLSVTLASDQDALPITDNAGSITVDGTVSVTGVATAANQATGNTSLSNIEGYVDGIETAIASTNTKLDTVHTDLGTLLTTGTPITGQSLESGGAGGLGWLSSVRKKVSDLIALLPTALGQTTMANSLAVTIASNQSAVPISDNFGSITVDTADTVIDVTPTMDTSAYAAGDIFFDTTAISGVGTVNGGTVSLDTITVLDEDDQGPTFQMVFLDTNNSLGTINTAPNISDANSRKIVGTLSSAMGTWVDLGGCRVMTIANIGLKMKCDAASTSLYFGAITSTATTQTASGLKFKLGFAR